MIAKTSVALRAIRKPLLEKIAKPITLDVKTFKITAEGTSATKGSFVDRHRLCTTQFFLALFCFRHSHGATGSSLAPQSPRSSSRASISRLDK